MVREGGDYVLQALQPIPGQEARVTLSSEGHTLEAIVDFLSSWAELHGLPELRLYEQALAQKPIHLTWNQVTLDVAVRMLADSVGARARLDQDTWIIE